MNALRKFCLALVSVLFIFLLFATACDVGFVRTVTQPETVKKLIAGSGVYKINAYDELQGVGSFNTHYGSFSATDALVVAAANQTLTPQFVQQSSETVIDSLYSWLDGKTIQPQFSINLLPQKKIFAQQAAQQIQLQTAIYPPCSVAQSRQMSQQAAAGQLDVYSLNCNPGQDSLNKIENEVATSIINDDKFLKNNISASDIKTSNGQSVFAQNGINDLPKQYQLAKKTPWTFAILTVLAGLGVVFLSRNWQIGLRHLGVSLAIIGVFMLALSFFLPRVVSKDIAPKLKVTNNSVNLNLGNVVNDTAQQIDKNYWLFGGLYTIAGVGSIAAAEVFSRRVQFSNQLPEASKPDSPDEQASKPKSKTKPPKVSG